MVPETHVYSHAQGCEIALDVYPLEGASVAPVVVWIHGGALIGGARGQVRPVLRELLTEAGFVQVSIDYRLAPETKLPQIISDVQNAFHWVRGEGASRYGIDPGRVAVLGGSAGGYLTLMCGTHVTPRPQALVSFYGYGDIVGDWYSRPDPFYCKQERVSEREARAALERECISNGDGKNDRFRFYLWCRQNGQWPKEIMGIDPARDPEAFAPYCPVRNVTPEFPPALLFHGTGDTDVPYQQSALMASALQAAQVPHGLVTYDNAPHGFEGGLKREELEAVVPVPRADATLRTVRFLKRWL